MNKKPVAPSLGKLDVNRMTGQEPFRLDDRRLDATLLEFWQWSSSDLVGNTLRGVLAEYIVGLALGCLDHVRVEWDAVDLCWRCDQDRVIRIEVKSTSYLQTWKQPKTSKPKFNIKKKQSPEPPLDGDQPQPKRAADVYVFCLFDNGDHEDKTKLDPLDLGHWSFYVLSTKSLERAFGNQKSVSLKPLEDVHGTSFPFPDLKSRVLAAANWCLPS
jgi:hypothetical protein